VLKSPLSGDYIGNNVLDAANSPYHVTDNVNFYDGTVEIEAGTSVVFDGNYTIRFESDEKPAKAHIKGTSSSRIYFTAGNKQAGAWSNIYMLDCEVDVNYAVFEYGSTGLTVAGPGTVKNSIFRQNSNNGMRIGDPTSSDHLTVIEHCEFYNNTNGILVNSPHPMADITYSKITNNGDNGIVVLDFKSFWARYNNILNNNGGLHDLYSTVNKQVDVARNWWGTTSTNTVVSHIYDSHSSVIFEPIENSTVPTAGLQ
jgi:hypothetical protein